MLGLAARGVIALQPHLEKMSRNSPLPCSACSEAWSTTASGLAVRAWPPTQSATTLAAVLLKVGQQLVGRNDEGQSWEGACRASKRVLSAQECLGARCSWAVTVRRCVQTLDLRQGQRGLVHLTLRVHPRCKDGGGPYSQYLIPLTATQYPEDLTPHTTK